MTQGRERRPESTRDQAESAFTPILRDLWASEPAVLAVAFVDAEGECIDYCASVEPFEAKVLAAHLMIVVQELVRRWVRIGFGHPHHLHLAADEREILARRVSEQYLLVASTEPGGVSRAVWRAMERAVTELRREAIIDVPTWEPYENPLEVEVRRSVGWAYAPVTFRRRDDTTGVADVLGRWHDEEEGWVCFRVRTLDGRELTLAHDPETDRWFELTDRALEGQR